MIKQSIVLKLGLGFLGCYILYSGLFFVYQVFQSYDRVNVQSIKAASNTLNMARILVRAEESGEKGRVQELAALLEDAIGDQEIDYYLIRKKDQDLFYSNGAGADDPVIFPETDHDASFEYPGYRAFIIREGAYYVAVGHKTSLISYVQHYAFHQKSSLLKDITFTSLIVLLLVIFSLRDLRAILRSIKKQSGDRTDLSLAKSSEALTLVQGIRGYVENADKLKKENHLLKGQVLPALQRELFSGRPAPYEFECTLVRTDINGFTSIFASDQRPAFMATINEFFTGVAHIASRYNGYIYEFIGDEVLLYFRDQDHVNSAGMALTALRDINALAERFHERTTEEQGYGFRVKSSLAQGTLRFGPLVDGFSLAGNPLIETVRMLSHVHEKSLNTILFGEGVRGQVVDLCVYREMGVVMLKGLQAQRRLFSYEHHVPLVHHLRQGDAKSLQLTSFYRSDLELCEILEFIRTNYEIVEIQTAHELLKVLRAARVTQDSAELRVAYVALLEKLLEKGEGDENEKGLRLAASLLTVAASLFTRESFRGHLRETLLRCARLKLPPSAERRPHRVVANAVDVFTVLDPKAAEGIFNELLEQNDNRIAANALLKAAKLSWGAKPARALQTLLRTGSPYFKASALFALGEIARHLDDLDKVSFRADGRLQKLIDESLLLLRHPNEMVRRQAFRSAIKCGRVEFLEDLFRQGQLEDELAAGLPSRQRRVA